MKICTFPDFVAIAGRPVYASFINYIKNHTDHEIVEDTLDADCALIWSVLWHGRMYANKFIYEKFKTIKKPVIILEVGALKRNITWRVSVDHIDKTGYYGNTNYLDLSRDKTLGIELQPWKKDLKDPILICGQHDQSELWKNMPTQLEWVKQVVYNLRKELDNEIIFRPHPRCSVKDINLLQKELKLTIQNPVKLQNTYDSFDFDTSLYNSSLVYTHTSNTGIQAALQGIPVYSSANSLAHEVSIQEDTLTPDREDWLIKLCHTEWTLEEIESGVPFRRIERYCLSKL